MDIAADPQGLWGLVQNGFETPLEQRAHPAILAIEPNTVAHIHPMHGSTQIALPGLNLQMIVVGHQYVAVDAHPKTYRQIAQHRQEFLVARSSGANGKFAVAQLPDSARDTMRLPNPLLSVGRAMIYSLSSSPDDHKNTCVLYRCDPMLASSGDCFN